MEEQKNTINNDIKCSGVKHEGVNNKRKPKENKLNTNKSKEYYHSLKSKADAYDKIIKAKTAQEIYDLLPKDKITSMYNTDLKEIIKNNIEIFSYRLKELDSNIDSTIQGYFKLTNRIEKIRLELFGMHLAILLVISIIFASILIIK